MDDFTSAFLNRGKGELRDLENTVSFTPFGVTPPAAVGNPQLTTADTALTSECTGEPESIRIWRKEFNESIEKRDFNESKKQALLQETAKKEIQDWEAWHQKNTLKSRQQNRMHEEELHAARDKVALLSASLAKVDPSDVAIWERICQLCDLAGPSVIPEPNVPTARRTQLLPLRPRLLQLTRRPHRRLPSAMLRQIPASRFRRPIPPPLSSPPIPQPRREPPPPPPPPAKTLSTPQQPLTHSSSSSAHLHKCELGPN
ncbi:hypothetical protein SprV_0501900100 [Sparganum proliferum]